MLWDGVFVGEGRVGRCGEKVGSVGSPFDALVL